MWWYSFLQVWNGVSMLPSSTPDQSITSDASGSWGCGVIYQNLWIQVAWPSQWADVSIAPQEMAPIVMAVALWGLQWKGTRVCSLCDNGAVVHIINKKNCKRSYTGKATAYAMHPLCSVRHHSYSAPPSWRSKYCS